MSKSNKKSTQLYHNKDLKRIQITLNFIRHENTVQLIGHVGQDPEVKNLEGGKKLANLSIATNEVYYKENGDKVENRMAPCNGLGKQPKSLKNM
jgi:hypothetical protein